MLETPCVKATPRTVPNKVANKPTTSVSVKNQSSNFTSPST